METNRKYGNSIMPFGRWRGIKLKEIPDSYFRNEVFYLDTMRTGKYVGETPLWYYTLEVMGIDPEKYKKAYCK